MSEDFKHEANQKQSGSAGVFVFFILLFLVAALALFAYVKSQNKDVQSMSLGQFLKGSLLTVQDKSKEKNITEIKLDTREKSVVNVYEGLLVKCTRDSIKGLSVTGEEQWSIPVSIGSPFLKAGGKYLLLADIGGRDIYVIEGRNIRWTQRLDNPIINADIGDNGYVTVVQEVKGYKGSVSVHNLQGMELFSRTLAANHVLGARVNPAGKMVFLNEVATTGLKPYSNFEVLDIQGKPLVSKKPTPESIFPSFWYLGNEMVFMVSDKAAVCVDKEGNEKWKIDFPENRILTSYVLDGKYAVFGIMREDAGNLLDKGKSEVKIVSGNGKIYASCSVEGEVKKISTGDGLIAAAASKKVYLISAKGKIMETLDTKTDITDVFFLKDREVAIITKGEVIISPVK